MSKEGGIGLAGILTIIFVVAKLFGIITWSWWWVFAPLWISGIIALFILLIVLIIAAINN
jgi:hypothetical protein